jgi:hypothetical protein
VEAVRILRQLWRQRLLAGAGLVLALVCGILMMYRLTVGLPPMFESRQYTVGVAAAEVLVDSPSSQVIDLGGGHVRTDVGVLTTRARLLASIMATSPLKDQIARAAAIDPRTFVADAPSLGPTEKPSTVEVAQAGPRGNAMTVYYNETLPIITAEAQAATEHVAARIASSAIDELSRYLTSVGAKDRVPDVRRLVVKPLGPARHATVKRGPSPLVVAVATLLLFCAWCAGIIVATRVARRWRQVAADEQRGELADAAGPGGSGQPEPPPVAQASIGSSRGAPSPALDDVPAPPERRDTQTYTWSA